MTKIYLYFNETWRTLSHYFYNLPKVVCSKLFSLVTVSFFLISLPEGGMAYHAQNFNEAKKIARIVWGEKRETFYCGCRYDRHGNIDFTSCDYVPADIVKADGMSENYTHTSLNLGEATSERSPRSALIVHDGGERAQSTKHKFKLGRVNKRISWEHVVPVSWYGRQRACWKTDVCLSKRGKRLSGRACCRVRDPLFRKMESELHNLVPEIRDLNMKRRHYAYTVLPNHQPGCQFYVDEKHQRVEPRDEVKGMAARITLYVTEKYQIFIKEPDRQILKEWDRRFPPTRWERRWHEQVAAIQGDRNPFIDYYNDYKKEVNR